MCPFREAKSESCTKWGVCLFCKKSRPDLEYGERLSQPALGEQEVCVLWTCGCPPLLPQSSRLFVPRFLASGLRAELPDRHFSQKPLEGGQSKLVSKRGSRTRPGHPCPHSRLVTVVDSRGGGSHRRKTLAFGKDPLTEPLADLFLHSCNKQLLSTCFVSGPALDTGDHGRHLSGVNLLRSTPKWCELCLRKRLPSPSLRLVLVKLQSDSHAVFIP